MPDAAAISAIASAVAAVAALIALAINLKAIRTSVHPVMVAEFNYRSSRYFPTLIIRNLGKGAAFNVVLEDHYWLFYDIDDIGRLKMKEEMLNIKENGEETVNTLIMDRKGEQYGDEDWGAHLYQKSGQRGVIFTDMTGRSFRTRYYINEYGKIVKIKRTRPYRLYHRAVNRLYGAIWIPLKLKWMVFKHRNDEEVLRLKSTRITKPPSGTLAAPAGSARSSRARCAGTRLRSKLVP